MISKKDLYDLAKCRFNEAKILQTNHMPEGAVYLCGYALELILKRKIVEVLDWDGYPDTDQEFKGLGSFKIHDPERLLMLSGLEKKMKADNNIWAKWQIASVWDSEMRYKPIGKTTDADALKVLEATRQVVNFIIR